MSKIIKCIGPGEASKFVGVSRKDLDLWRQANCGPNYYLLPPVTEKGKSKIVYDLDELKEWVLKYRIIVERPEVSGAERYWRTRRNARKLIKEQKLNKNF